MKHAQRTEKYIRLIFNSYISDDDFFQKSMRIIDTNYFFSGDFQGQEGVRIYATLMMVVLAYIRLVTFMLIGGHYILFNKKIYVM